VHRDDRLFYRTSLFNHHLNHSLLPWHGRLLLIPVFLAVAKGSVLRKVLGLSQAYMVNIVENRMALCFNLPNSLGSGPCPGGSLIGLAI
jgi:hypothetical protein